MTPRYSIIIPTLNEKKFLPALLTSLSQQTKKNFEVIVVDGASRDGTEAVARSFAKTLPLTVYSTTTRGVAHQRNIGGNRALGEWFLFVDADSVFYPHTIERIDQFIINQKPDLFTTWFAPDTNLPRQALYALIGNVYVESSVMMHRPIAPGPLTIVTKKKFLEVGGYNEALTFGEDYDFSKRVCDTGTQMNIQRETLYIFSQRRVHAYGTFSFLRAYIPGSLYVLFTKHAIGKMPGYVMGGEMYNKRKSKQKRSSVWRFDLKVQELLRELLG